MTKVTLSDAVRPGANVLFRELEGEGILLSLESGKYFGLDAVGTRIWQLLGAGPSLTGVCETLAAEFDVERATIEADLLALVAELSSHGLVLVAEHAPSA